MINIHEVAEVPTIELRREGKALWDVIKDETVAPENKLDEEYYLGHIAFEMWYRQNREEKS